LGGDVGRKDKAMIEPYGRMHEGKKLCLPRRKKLAHESEPCGCGASSC